jgi:hypothetical protein
MIWKPVVGFNGLYEVSDQGSVRAKFKLAELDILAGGRLLKQQIDKDGYKRLTLYKDSVRKEYRIHQLVARAFLGPCPQGMEVCHNDGNPANNCVSNLRYGTKSENTLDAIQHGTRVQDFQNGERHPNSKLEDSGVREIRKLRQAGLTFQSIANQYGVGRRCISDICNRVTWSHVK